MVDVAADGQEIIKGEIYNIRLVRSHSDIADALTKHMSQELMRNIIKSRNHFPSPTQRNIGHKSHPVSTIP